MGPGLKKFIQTGAKVGGAAAEIVGGALGGPAGAAGGKALAGGVNKVANRVTNMPARVGPGGFTPSSAGSVEEGRSQDKSRLHQQYPGLIDMGEQSS